MASSLVLVETQAAGAVRVVTLGELNPGFAIANDRLSRQRIPYAAGCLGAAIKAQEILGGSFK